MQPDPSRRIVSLLFVMALAILVAARPTGAAPEVPYRVQPGDTLEVRFWSEDEEAKEVVVDTAGSIAYPPVGIVAVKGLTLAEAGKRLAEELKKKAFRSPRIDVVLKARAVAAAQAEVYVLGAVGKPGSLPFSEGMRVMDAIGRAGGLGAVADGARATVSRPSKGALPVDLGKLLGKGDMEHNIALEPGDMLVVPALAKAATEAEMLTVLVSGQVNRPGAQKLPPGARFSDAVDAAGGVLAAAGLKQCILARGDGQIEVNLGAILREGDRTADLALQTGDRILVPEARNRVTLLGEFQKPGSYTFKEGDRITDAMALGGGATPDGDLRGARLRRADKETPVDLDAVLRLADLKSNQLLQNGDVLVVPTGVRIYALGAFQKPGIVTLKRDANLMDALLAAGGQAPRANLAKASVVRVVDGKPKPIPLNIQAAVAKGAAGRDFAFAEGDVLFLPEKGKSFEWRSILSIMSAATLLGLNPLSRW